MKNDNDNNNNNSRNSGMKKKKKKRVEIVIRSKRKNLGQQQQHRILDKLESRIIFFWNENFSRCFFSFHFSNEKNENQDFVSDFVCPFFCVSAIEYLSKEFELDSLVVVLRRR